MVKNLKTKKEIVKVHGKLKQVTSFHDNKGKVIHRIISPLKFEFDIKDILQIIVGATILAIPVGFTEETWKLGKILPLWNISLLFIISLAFISLFTYYTYHTEHKEKGWGEFFKRVIATYVFSFIIVTVLLCTIERAHWFAEPLLALKRSIIVTLPASMSAAVADVLK